MSVKDKGSGVEIIRVFYLSRKGAEVEGVT